MVIVAAIAGILVVLRSAVWVWFEQAHFHADHAIAGLMARHITDGRALPLFYYGQHYMLAVTPYVTAPFFLLFGASVATLKLPLLLINIVVAVVLVVLLVRRVGLA